MAESFAAELEPGESAEMARSIQIEQRRKQRPLLKITVRLSLPENHLNLARAQAAREASRAAHDPLLLLSTTALNANRIRTILGSRKERNICILQSFSP